MFFLIIRRPLRSTRTVTLVPDPTLCRSILMQRGSGAKAGTGFGGGASATVFGSRGSSNFLSKATKWLAIVFFAITLFMAWHVTRTSQPGLVQQDLGLMSEVPAAPPPATGEIGRAHV